MRNHARAGLFLLLLLVFGSCSKLFPPPLENTWRVTKIETATNDEESELIYRDAFISFYENGVLTFLNKNEHDPSLGKPIYREGTWKKNDNNLKIALNKTLINPTFRIVELSNTWLVIEITDGPNETIGTIL